MDKKKQIIEKDVWKARGQELIEKNVLDDSQKESLEHMIDSPDDENFVLAKELLRLKISDALVEGLNDGQAYAFTKIIEFFMTPGEYNGVVLKGYAGTGKTYLVKRIIEYASIADPKHKEAITAPTNKAVHVLHKNSPFTDNTTVFEDYGRPKDRIVYCTIHKLMNLKEQISDTGKQTFVTDMKNGNEIEQYKYIIVDETSMLDDNLFLQLMKYKDKIKFIFLGDPAQIPPVNRTDCIPFKQDNKYNLLRLELTEIMRQKGDHPIIDAGYKIRNNLTSPSPLGKISTILNGAGHGIIHIDAKTNRKHTRKIIEKYFKSPEYQNDIDYVKIIAWKNKTVESLNNITREILFGKDINRFVVGDKLVANKALFDWTNHSKFGKIYSIKANTSDEFVIQEAVVKEKRFIETSTHVNERVDATLKCWSLKVKYKADYLYLRVIHEDSMAEYLQLLSELKAKAKAARNSSLWAMYYNVVKWNDDVIYNYAISAHKS